MPTLLVLGATSDIARATALSFGMAGWDIFLAGRDMPKTEAIGRDLSIRTGRPVTSFLFEAGVTDSETFWASLPTTPDAVLCAIGQLGDQERCRHDPVSAQQIMKANFTDLVPILSVAADSFEAKQHGLIIGISSVAGDRGRASNYMYGAAKAGLTTFLSGLRNRLAGKGVHVLTVKPGFVKTKMTEHLPLPPLLTATPEEVGEAILYAAQKKKNSLYVKPIWRPIMAGIRLLPENVFKKLKI